MISSPVLLFSIDGMRPDALQQAETPALDALIVGGASLSTRPFRNALHFPLNVCDREMSVAFREIFVRIGPPIKNRTKTD